MGAGCSKSCCPAHKDRNRRPPDPAKTGDEREPLPAAAGSLQMNEGQRSPPGIDQLSFISISDEPMNDGYARCGRSHYLRGRILVEQKWGDHFGDWGRNFLEPITEEGENAASFVAILALIEEDREFHQVGNGHRVTRRFGAILIYTKALQMIYINSYLFGTSE